MTHVAAPGRQADYPAVVSIGLAAAIGYVVLSVWALANLSFDVAGGLLVAPILGAWLWAGTRRSAQRSDDEWLLKILPWALTAKLAGTLIRYIVIFVVYEEGDARDYDVGAKIMAPALRHFEIPSDLGKVPGTGFMRLLTGSLYAVIGPSRLGGFLVFSFIGFVGVFLLYRAFRIALPHADNRRYGLLLFFLPSMLFWPSSTGKEAWMLLMLGISARGAVALFASKPVGLLIFAIGASGMALLRPHVALALVLSLIAAYFVRRPEVPTPMGPATKLFGLIVLVIGALFLVSRVETFFNVDALDSEGIAVVQETTATENLDDASSFKPVIVRSPLDVPAAAATVLFRPFPFEARNALSLFSSLEGMLLLGLSLLSARRAMTAIRQSPRFPYIALAAVYVLVFIYAFSSFANFGLLARQRVQVLPLLLVLLAWVTPPLEQHRRPRQYRVPRLAPAPRMPAGRASGPAPWERGRPPIRRSATPPGGA